MKKIAILLKGYPRLSETFIAQEIAALEQRGFDVDIISLRHPTDKKTHPIHKKITADVYYLPEYLHQEPLRVLKGFFHSFKSAQLKKLLCVFWQDFKKDRSRNRIRRLGQAMVLNRELDKKVVWMYVHFLHTPASVTHYCSILNELPWSCSAHAKDIWTSPKWEIQQKLEHLQWLVTCTQSNQDYLQSLSQQPSKVILQYHGLDIDLVAEYPIQSVDDLLINHDNQLNQGGQVNDNGNPAIILSVGRAVNKKGYDVLLNALHALPENLSWRFVHVGGGELLDSLKQQAIDLKIDHKMLWLGPQSADTVFNLYRRADLFVLASRIESNGDRDGIPNVLMEAMCQKLACVASHISGIPELIIDGVNGRLVAPEDPLALANVLQQLLENPDIAKQYADDAYNKLLEKFTLDQNISILVDLFKSHGIGDTSNAKEPM